MAEDNNITTIKDILKTSKFMTLATASASGFPWLSPVYFAYDKQFTLYWRSHVTSQHAKYTAENSQASVIFYDPAFLANPMRGNLLMTGHAFLVESNEFTVAFSAYFNRYTENKLSQDNISKLQDQFLQDETTAFYKFVPNKYYLVTPPVDDTGVALGGRKEITIPSLQLENTHSMHEAPNNV